MFGQKKQLQAAHTQALQARIRTLEELVVQLADRAGVSDEELAQLHGTTDPGITARVETLVADGKVIEAIKEYRERTGAGLTEAKDAIDAYRARSA